MKPSLQYLQKINELVFIVFKLQNLEKRFSYVAKMAVRHRFFKWW